MPWLTVLIFLPLVGIPVLALWRGASDVQARAVALVVSLATFLVALGMLGAFDPSVAGLPARRARRTGCRRRVCPTS